MTKRDRKRPASSHVTKSRREWSPVTLVLAILALTFWAYLPSLDNEFTNWDDPQYVLENPLLANPDLGAILRTPVGGNYHPLTVLSLAANYRLSGFDPSSYHALSLGLHLANTAFVFAFIWVLTRGRRWTSAVSSLLFGIHPMHVESVAWVAERKDVLYAFFYLLGLLAYLRYLDKLKLRWWAATGVAFLLSLASKPAAVVFPVTLLAIDWYRQRAWSPRWLIEKSLWFAMSIGAGLLTLQAQAASGALERQPDLFTRVLSAAYGFASYLVKLVLPTHLSAIYPYPGGSGSGPTPATIAAFVAVVVGIPLALYLLRRRRETWFGFAFFLINIALVLQVVGVGRAVMADRYTYLPYIGLILPLAFPLDGPRSKGPARLATSALAVAIALLSAFSLFATRARCDVWQSSETLWSDTIRKYPEGSADAYINRGLYYHRVARRPDLALADYDKAVALNPGAPSAWNNRGRILAERGEPDSAIASFDRSIALRPEVADVWNNRGGQRLIRGDLEGGIRDISQAIALDSLYWDAYANRAVGFGMRGDYPAAIADCLRLIELQPDHPDLHQYYGLMGKAYLALGRSREAIAALDKAISLAPATEPRRRDYYLERSRAWGALGDLRREREDALEAERWRQPG